MLKLLIILLPVGQGCRTRSFSIFRAFFEEDFGVAGVVGRVEVGEEDDHDVAGQADEDVPDSVQKRNAEMAPNVAKHLKNKVIKCILVL